MRGIGAGVLMLGLVASAAGQAAAQAKPPGTQAAWGRPGESGQSSYIQLDDAHGRRQAYGRTDVRTGITDLYDAQTSARLGSIQRGGTVLDTHSQRLGTNPFTLVSPKGKK